MPLVRLQGAALLVISLSTTLAGTPGRSERFEIAAPSQAQLRLTEEERSIIMHNVRTLGGSTLALGALSEGADVPHGVVLMGFPRAVLGPLPKMAAYRYFSIENVIAIVDPRTLKVLLVIDGR